MYIHIYIYGKQDFSSGIQTRKRIMYWMLVRNEVAALTGVGKGH